MSQNDKLLDEVEKYLKNQSTKEQIYQLNFNFAQLREIRLSD